MMFSVSSRIDGICAVTKIHKVSESHWKLISHSCRWFINFSSQFSTWSISKLRARASVDVVMLSTFSIASEKNAAKVDIFSIGKSIELGSHNRDIFSNYLLFFMNFSRCWKKKWNINAHCWLLNSMKLSSFWGDTTIKSFFKYLVTIWELTHRKLIR